VVLRNTWGGVVLRNTRLALTRKDSSTTSTRRQLRLVVLLGELVVRASFLDRHEANKAELLAGLLDGGTPGTDARLLVHPLLCESVLLPGHDLSRFGLDEVLLGEASDGPLASALPHLPGLADNLGLPGLTGFASGHPTGGPATGAASAAAAGSLGRGGTARAAAGDTAGGPAGSTAFGGAADSHD